MHNVKGTLCHSVISTATYVKSSPSTLNYLGSSTYALTLNPQYLDEMHQLWYHGKGASKLALSCFSKDKKRYKTLRYYTFIKHCNNKLLKGQRKAVLSNRKEYE